MEVGIPSNPADRFKLDMDSWLTAVSPDAVHQQVHIKIPQDLR